MIFIINNYANQRILTKVKKVDSNSERTLEIITKFNRLSSKFEIKKAFLNLARNENIFFKLGWHVFKNRSFKEKVNSFLKRNVFKAAYFRKFNFKILP